MLWANPTKASHYDETDGETNGETEAEGRV